MVWALAVLLLLSSSMSESAKKQRRTTVRRSAKTAGKSTAAKKKSVKKKRQPVHRVLYRSDPQKLADVLDHDDNIILNDSAALPRFISALSRLKETHAGTVSIFQFGDSHIQNGIIAAQMRAHLQAFYGNAGRGLVTPYTITKRSSIYDYQFTSDNRWPTVTNLHAQGGPYVGIGGVFVSTEARHPVLHFRLPGSVFSSISMIPANTSMHPVVTMEDTLTLLTRPSAAVGFSGDELVGNYNLGTATNNFTVSMEGAAAGDNATIYGFILRTDSAGIFYNSAGISGTTFSDFIASPNFIAQSKFLSPDLIVISLGTNDLYTSTIQPEEFRHNLDTLVNEMRNVNPLAEFIITTPPDNLRKHHRTNNNLPIASHLIQEYCTEHNLACWDLYTVMGGKGSVSKWYKAGMISYDMVHCTRDGYRLQGDLFFEALSRSIGIPVDTTGE
jgi:lysophospholipase L1-like esterase